MRKILGLFAGISLLLLANLAPVAASNVEVTPWTTAGVTTLAVSGTTARVLLPSTDYGLLVYNTLSSNIHFKLGDVTITAATTDTIIPAGTVWFIHTTGKTYLALISDSASGTINIAQGHGDPYQSPIPNSAAIAAAITCGGAACATATKQDTGNTSLSSLDTKMSTSNTNTGAIATSDASIDTKLSSQATAAKQDTGNTSLSSLDTKLSTLHSDLNPCHGGTCINCFSGDVANAIATCTLAGTSGKTTYITGWKCNGTGATAGSIVTIAIAGLVSTNMSAMFSFNTGATNLDTLAGEDFTSPIPASASNTAITVTLPAGGAGNAHAMCSGQGFQL